MDGPNYNTLPPSGIDRADGSLVLGTGYFPGTPTLADTESSNFATSTSGAQPSLDGTFFEEFPDSPRFDFGEKGTCQHRYQCDPATYVQLLQAGQLTRGTWVYDSLGDASIILNATAEYQKGNYYVITITSEGLNWGLPPDEFDIQPQEINPDLMKHPRYNYGPNGANTSTGYGLTAQQKGALRYLLQSGNSYSAQDLFQQILGQGAGNNLPGSAIDWTDGISGNTIPQQMAWEIIQKYYRGEDTFYLPAFAVTYTKYFISPQALNPGGYIEDPVAEGVIPYFFWSIDGSDDAGFSNNILQNFPSSQIGNLYKNGVTYLRKADTFKWDIPLYRLTMTWIGAPTGPADSDGNNYIYWDPDLYDKDPTPLGALPT